MTLKAFKESLRVGMQLRTSDHWLEPQRNTLRTITKLQTNGFFYTLEGTTGRHWMDFPRAAQVTFADHTARIRMDERRFWTLHLGPHGKVDHHRWERTRGDENECDAERRFAAEAEAQGANMPQWWQQWLERSDEWRNEIGHDADYQLEALSP